MSQTAQRIETGNASVSVARAILRIGVISPASSSLLMSLSKKEITSGTLAIGLDDRLRCVLIYNKYFINLLGEIHPRLIENALLHELGHILYFHLISGKRSIDPYDKFLDNLAKDFLVNTHVAVLLQNKSKQTSDMSAILPLPCVSCSKANTIDAYIEEARGLSSIEDGRSISYGFSAVMSFDACVNALEHYFTELKSNPPGCNKCVTGYMTSSSKYIEGCRNVRTLLTVALKETTEGDVPAKMDRLKKLCSILFPKECGGKDGDMQSSLFPNMEEGMDKETLGKVFKPFNPMEIGSLKELYEVTDEQSVEVKSRLSDAIAKASAGKDSAYGISDIGALNKENTVKWDRYLRQAICTKISQVVRPSRLRRNRRFGFDQPGSVKEDVVNIVVAIDSSGSMPSELLARIKSNILSLKGAVTLNVTILEFDTEVVAAYSLDKLDSVRYSYGGTDLKAPIQWCIDNKVDPGSLLFIFTDGLGDATMSIEDIPELKKYSYIWMLTKDGYDRYILDGFNVKKSRIVRLDV